MLPRSSGLKLRRIPAISAAPCLIVVLILAISSAQAPSRVPPEVLHKSAYINASGKPAEFTSVMLWGIAIADNRVPNYEKAIVEIAGTQLVCRVDAKDFFLNNDSGEVRGGLYRRYPWFGTDAHGPMPTIDSRDHGSVILRVGMRSDRVWHFWAASPRAEIPRGHLDGCTVRVRARVSGPALLQVGFDYWRNPTVGYGSGGNNREAGASDWYFSSPDWQEAIFSDMNR